MKAALFKAVGEPLAIEDVPDPEPGEGEAVIRVARCGVCGTDLHSTSGHGYTLPAGAQLGHEYAGEVVAVGRGVRRLKVGDRVAALPVVGCGECEACRTGIDVLCSRWRGYGGGLADYARISERGATLLPQTLSLADGALVEPFAVGRRGVRLADPAPTDRVLIVGPGPIGLSVLFWLRRAGVRAVALLASSDRRRPLAEAMGAEHFLLESDAAQEEITAALGGAPDIVFECAGVPGTIARSIALVRPQGRIVSLGFCMVPDQFVPGMALMKDVALRFSLIYTREDYTECAAALDADGDRARAMVTDTVSLADAPAAFERLRTGTGGGGKLLIDPWLGR
ncbi:alcohol dehydrogenase catalytic domain-containing protein [Sphingopyxis panaciterrulae]|uniref:(R,R)-butanediol dehydrogenase/meso-butanediol dehydrogenase/diacetyl reductase n=1 Tax=Sphingopyxis panaciterrulae TaxID=462372 RepID=A0A7W9B2J9_9SPHN|nr:alcohol dehydrogenase catalytic domain-containing protein [Sphingopyxis panaciterrulae]MBB5705078.1 (R,R)-butanediol dehydrogenase/meso-butanediol dehydrogenase/diacetyl reductase [Sphingopyxis panaciterrulae]